MHKSIVTPDFSSKTVLVTDTWDYVTMWLKRQHKKDALFYWQQAHDFHEASKLLSNTAAPLTLYYCFLNGTKALLSSKGIAISDHHGVSGKTTTNTAALNNEEIYFLSKGVLSGLCTYLGEPCSKNKYTAKDILYNLPYIHRAYNLTFPSQSEIFIPIKNGKYVKKDGSTESWFMAEVEDKKYKNQHTINKLPTGFEKDLGIKEKFVIRRINRFKWKSGSTSKFENIQRLNKYHISTRQNVYYIHGNTPLWYVKRANNGSHFIQRSSLTMTFALMHRLSELARYNPLLLFRHFESQHNWLLSEFIATSGFQFIDEISSEITGQQFMVPGRRS